MAAAALALAALAPWLVLVPATGVLAVGSHVLALIAALHGAGCVLARLAGRPAVPAMLAIQWGLASLVGLMGIAIAIGAGGLATQVVLVYGFAGVHTAVIAIRFAAYREQLAAARPRLRFLLVPAGLLAAIAILHVLGNAGDLGARPFDDDGHVLAQLQRLRETGALGDPIGYARGAQLGGQLALEALATCAGDVHLARLAEGLALVLALGLALARLRPAGQADATSGLWGLLVVLAGAALTYVRPDPAACWTAAGLVLALHATVADHDGAPLPIGVLAGALAALRLELAPIAAIALIAAWWRHRRDVRHAALLVGGALAVVAPYAIARALAWSAVPAAAHALVEPTRPPLGYSAGFLWPLAIAAALVLVIRLARNRNVAVAALLGSLIVMVFIYEGRAAGGRKRWTRRYLDLAYDLDYLRTARDPAPVASGYEPLLRAVPAGATVAVWVTRPERLPYGAAFRIVDLRTPRAAWIRAPLPWSAADRVEARLAGAGADLLLLEDETRPAPPTAPRDGLAEVAARHATVAEAGGVRLIDLRRPHP